jgi:hypothetical protein
MEWKVNVTATAASLFDMKIDLVRYATTNAYYGLDLEEQWTNVNITRPNQDLCINMGNFSGSENLMVDVWDNRSGPGHWGSLFNATNLLVSNTWNNVSVTQYLTSSTFTIRFRSNDTSDTHQDYWNVSSVLLKLQPDLGFLLSQQNSSTTVVEWLQNGAMRWIGQNLNLTTQAKPIPPIPVKAIHMNQTVNGVDREVPFQVEDWASNYSIPLGLTGNATVFGNRQMIVFLLNTTVTKVTIWWNGSDMATQTPYAYTPGAFNDNPSAGTLNNGKLTLQFGGGFSVTSTVGSASSTASFMRINGNTSDYGAGLAYVIYNGPVRDIMQQEAEWGNGVLANSCPNVYANMVLTLPAGTSYFTYQLRLMFINSTQRPRTITDLCPIQLSTSLSTIQIQTENGTIDTSPIVASGTGTFKNYGSSGTWTAHHWSQFNSTIGAGAGIMFTKAANQLLYAFDPPVAGATTGALNVSSTAKTIELAPVTSLSQVTGFTTPNTYDVTWCGAVATFDSNTTPIYTLNANNQAVGLWILVEYQPTITVTPEN